MKKGYNKYFLKCRICGKNFRHLGSHVYHGHGLLAKEYKSEFGLDYNTPLISQDIKEKKHNRFEERREYYLGNIRKVSKKYRFKKGQKGIRHYYARESLERMKKQLKGIIKDEIGICQVCNMIFTHLDSHLFNKHALIRVKNKEVK